jgi:hypothetical protein
MEVIGHQQKQMREPDVILVAMLNGFEDAPRHICVAKLVLPTWRAADSDE